MLRVGPAVDFLSVWLAGLTVGLSDCRTVGLLVESVRRCVVASLVSLVVASLVCLVGCVVASLVCLVGCVVASLVCLVGCVVASLARWRGGEVASCVVARDCSCCWFGRSLRRW